MLSHDSVLNENPDPIKLVDDVLQNDSVMKDLCNDIQMFFRKALLILLTPRCSKSRFPMTKQMFHCNYKNRMYDQDENQLRHALLFAKSDVNMNVAHNSM